MGFRLQSLRLRVSSTDGAFGTDIPFSDGLNIIGAPNTAGKSTCIQALLYALGLEGMLGPAREVPLPHAMTHSIEDADGVEHQVLESQVLLEITDHTGSPLTIRRYAMHSEIDKDLISVWEASLEELDRPTPIHGRDFYVRRSGAAQREAGFHRFLAERLGWDLPEVPRFNGGHVPLYQEAIAPLWFVEQKRGWAGIQAQSPGYLQIRDVRRRALEFILDLDIQERASRIEELLVEQREVLGLWLEVVAEIESEAAQLGVTVEGLPRRPSAEWPLAVPPRLQVSTTDGWEGLKEYFVEQREKLRNLEQLDFDAPGASSEQETQLREMIERLHRLDVLANENASQLALERATAADSRMRVEAVDEDIRRHQDLLVLDRMGSRATGAITQADCPTCHKPLDGVLLDHEDLPQVLAADLSIAVLRQRRELLKALVNEADSVVAARENKTNRLRITASDMRSSIRALKDSLVAPSATPSAALIEQVLSLRKEVGALDALRDAWIVALDALEGASQQWASVITELNALRDDDFSSDDRAKLVALEQSFQVQLANYEFRSCPVDQIAISLDDYLPTHEGFELALDFSASDGIRVIWAYLIGLLEVSKSFETNHPGVVVFDEPRQQAAAEVSFSALLARAAHTGSGGGQVLFATSEPPESLAAMVHDLDVNMQQYSGKLIRRL